jgi:hypothetical protein
MLERLFPEKLDNVYTGRRAGLWLFAVLMLIKLAMSVNVIFNGAKVASDADGIPLASYPPEAAHAVVVMFGIWGIAQLALCLVGALVLWRYRAMVPVMFAVFLLEHLVRRAYLVASPVARVGNPPAPYVNLVLLAIAILGLVLSLWRAPARR